MSLILSIFCKSVSSKAISKMIVRQSSGSFEAVESCMEDFRQKLKSARNVVFLTGSGISEESGLPTFSGSGPVWRNLTGLALTYPPSFTESPSLFWEFYNYRRELAAKARPNVAHIAIANYELKYRSEKKITIITQNVDSMHARAGSVNLIELHGNLFKTRCTACDAVAVNIERPICPALANTGSPEVNAAKADIATDSLPRCDDCGALVRPYIVWFGESVDPDIKDKANEAISTCDVCVAVSTSTLVSPAAALLPAAAARGAVLAEFNIEPTPNKLQYDYYFQGPCSRTLPAALAD